MANERIMVKKVVDTIGVYSFEGPLKGVLETIQNLIDMYGEDAGLDYGQHHEYDTSYSFGIMVQRLETDEEFAKRLSDADLARVRQLENLQSAAKQLGYDITKKVV